MGILDRIFGKKQSHKQIILDELRAMKADQLKLDFFFDFIIKALKKIPDRVFDSDFDSDEGQTERLFIASSLTNRAADLLESGRFHLWRGLLNPIGEELLKLINNEVNYAKECGRVSQEWVDKFYKDLNKNISKVG